VLLAGTVLAGALVACGTRVEPAPNRHSTAERIWVANAVRFVATAESDILATTVGGANLATARKALANDSDVYSMLVAYSFFGDCNRELANLGTASADARQIVTLLLQACRRLERASMLFEQAVSRNEPRTLVAAGRASLVAEPLLTQAQLQLRAFR
jgi:hypothetical protein